mmetsp:Transcript_41683/g.73292  ORF Transcript_41683/g.73292 Transcript_41683/m.73292 type:complete len:243 (+) Transcript_41683:64-792(+)
MCRPQRALTMSVEKEEEVEMSEEEYLASQDDPEQMSEEAKRVYRGMRSVTGVELAPWMKVDVEKIAAAKRAQKERKARSSSQPMEQMMIDPQAAELGAGGGLKSKVLSEEEVELRWSTGDESGNVGFIVQRRKGGSSAFEDIASHANFAPLKTKGSAGGEYSYLDDSVPGPGTYVYRVCDEDSSGKRSGICQKLVEVESASEQTQTLVIGGVIAGLALVLVAFGIASDPIQTTDVGRGGFSF